MHTIVYNNSHGRIFGSCLVACPRSDKHLQYSICRNIIFNMPDLVEAILSRDQAQSESPALILAGLSEHTLTYTTLRSCVRRLRAVLGTAGLSRGSVCCLALPNGPAYVAVFLAAMDLKAVVAPLNPALKQNEISYAVNSLAANVIVGPKDFLDQDADLARACAERKCVLAESYWDEGGVSLNIIRQSSNTERPMAMLGRGDDFAALALHTSGTTGKPKSVPLLQSNLQASADNVIKAYDLTAADRSVLIMPLFHIHGIVAGLLAPLLAGCSVIIPQEGFGSDFWTHFEAHQATWWTATPTHHKILLSFPRPPKHVQPRFIRSCSSPLAPNLLRELEAAFKAPVLEAYAMTENAHLIASHVLGHEKRLGTVGLPCNTISLKIVDDNEKEVHQGQVGEVVIKGPSVTPGYFDNPEANSKAFTTDGYFRTGDQGLIDDFGHVRLTGRLKELINKGGEKISPNEVDQVVIEHEDISEAVAFAAPDELYGEEVAIAIVPRPGTTIKAADLRQWLQGRIADFKIPRHICVMEVIPKTATGKVQRTALSGLAMPSDDESHADDGSLEQIWSRILGIDASSIRKDSNFFDLGGNSVQAIRLAAEAKSGGWNLDAATVFRSPTLGGMTEQCTRQESIASAISGSSNTDLEELRNDAAQACGVASSSIQDIATATPLQRRLASLNRDLGLWVMSLTFLCQNVDLVKMEDIVDTIRSRNPILRSRTVCIGDETYNAIVQDQATWETSSSLSGYLTQVAGGRVLYGAPQVRYAYIYDRDEGPHFVLTATHAVLDVWTRNLMYEELKMGLTDLAKLRNSPAPISFCEFARYAASVDRQEAERYWSNLLSGFDRWSYLARDDERSTVGTKILTKAVHPKSSQDQDLSDIARIHLAWCLALSSLSAQDRIFFLTVSSGRLADVPGMESMMGPTMTTVPVCVDLSTFATIAAVLAHIRSALFGSVKYEALAPEHTTRHFRTTGRETLLNCSEVPEYDGMTIAARDASLRLCQKDNIMYGRLSVLMNMRVSKQKGGLRLQAAYELSALNGRIVEDVLGCFAGFLQEVGSAASEASLAEVRDSGRKGLCN